MSFLLKQITDFAGGGSTPTLDEVIVEDNLLLGNRQIDTEGFNFAVGDVNENGSGTRLELSDAANEGLLQVDGRLVLGDDDGNNNGTLLSIDNTTETVTINAETFDAGGAVIKQVNEPVDGTDAVTKNYVDQVNYGEIFGISGIDANSTSFGVQTVAGGGGVNMGTLGTLMLWSTSTTLSTVGDAVDIAGQPTQRQGFLVNTDGEYDIQFDASFKGPGANETYVFQLVLNDIIIFSNAAVTTGAAHEVSNVSMHKKLNISAGQTIKLATKSSETGIWSYVGVNFSVTKL